MAVILSRPVVLIGGKTYAVTGIEIKVDNDLDRQVRDAGFRDAGIEGWWALRYKRRLECGCGYTGEYAHETSGRHRVIVWPDALDPNLRKMNARTLFDAPAPYERAMGPAVSYYEAHPS